MGKILITEDQLEILTGHVLFNEQEEELQKDKESDEERLGFKSSIKPGEFKTYEGGQPYELFLAKTDTLSKAFFQSGEYSEVESKSLYFKYRRPNPLIAKIKKWETELEESLKSHLRTQMKELEPYFSGQRQIHPTDKEDYIQMYGKDWVNNKEKVQQIIIDGQKQNENWQPKIKNNIKKLQEKLKELLSKKRFDEKYQYSTEGGKRKDGWEKNPEYDPEGTKTDKAIAQAKKKVGDVTFSPADRLEVMYQIVKFVQKEYDGDYEGAASNKVWKRKGTKLTGSGWVKRGIETIILRPTNIKIKVTETEVIADEAGTLIEIWPSDADGQLFLNNLWAPSPLFKKQLDEMVENILINKANVSKRFNGANVKMSIATTICAGGGNEPIDCSKNIKYPYTISSSCSQVPNGVDDKGVKLKTHGGTSTNEAISFEQLSKNRANTAKQLIAQRLEAIGIEVTDPIINWGGEHKNGTSAPAYKQGGPVESEAYKLARYVKINLAVRYQADVTIPEPPEPVQYKVGDLKVVIKADYESWDPWWRIPPIKWPKWNPFKRKFKNKKNRGKINTIACPKFGVKGSLSRKSRTSMSSRR